MYVSGHENLLADFRLIRRRIIHITVKTFELSLVFWDVATLTDVSEVRTASIVRE
jgi:hypothetical protein